MSRILSRTMIVFLFILSIPAAAPAGTTNIGEESNGGTITLAAGDYLTLALPANPSTGYGWHFVSAPDPQVLKPLEEKYRPDNTGLAGTGGTETRRYQAMGSGSASIGLAYMRPWESVQPLKRFSLEVIVIDPQDHGVTVLVNGSRIVFPGAEPYISADGLPMVPVRFISEALGAQVGWDPDRQLVTINIDGETIALNIGQKTVLVNGTEKYLEAAPVVVKGRTMAPPGFAGAFPGVEVNWEAETKTITINKK
ncbi:MAG: stalk domain-containing protein [Bacillota bacterium]